jgi:hypothetical protein
MKYWLIGITAALSLMAAAPGHSGAVQQVVASTQAP